MSKNGPWILLLLASALFGSTVTKLVMDNQNDNDIDGVVSCVVSVGDNGVYSECVWLHSCDCGNRIETLYPSGVGFDFTCGKCERRYCLEEGV